MDKKELVKLAKENPMAKATFKVLLDRQREPREGRLELRRVIQDARRSGVRVVKSDFMGVFQQLERLGIGKVITAKGKEPSFQWSASMKDTCSAALDGFPFAETAAQRAGTVMKEIHVVLGRGRRATCTVPADMTAEEAEFLLTALQSQD